MSFEESLHTIVGSLAATRQQAWQGDERARNVIAFHGPYLLRRFADMAAAFAAPALRSGQGTILARRDAYGYHTVEFVASDLHIVFEVFEGVAHLFWLAGGKTDDRPIAMETPSTVIDAMLIDAVSAYAESRTEVESPFAHRATTKETRHA